MTQVVAFANYDIITGQYTRASWCDPSSPELAHPGVYRGSVDINGQYHDVVRNVPVNMPTRPSRLHKFDFITKTWEFDSAHAWAEIRAQRNSLLEASDWTQMPDAPVITSMRSAWAAYRQALRDVPKQLDPTNIIWPTPPAST